MEMETLVEAETRLRAAGYTEAISATDSGDLACPACGAEHAPATMEIHEVVRYEGASDPSDEAILLALSCTCGQLGLYSCAYGADITTADARVLAALPRT